MVNVSDETRTRLNQAGENVSEAARCLANDVSAKARESYETSREQMGRWTRQAEEYVHTKPWTALAIAAAAGFIFGWARTPRA